MNYKAAVKYMNQALAEGVSPEQEAEATSKMKFYIDKGIIAYNRVTELLPTSHLGFLWRANITSLIDNVEYAKTEKMSGAAKKYFEEAIEFMLKNNGDGARNKDIVTGYDYLSNYYFVNKDEATCIEYNKKIVQLDPANEKAKSVLEMMGVKI